VVLAASQEAGAPAAPAAKEKHNPNRLADSQKKLQTCARALRNRMVRTEGEVVMMMMMVMMMVMLVMVMVDILVISCVYLRLSRHNNHRSTTYILQIYSPFSLGTSRSFSLGEGAIRCVEEDRGGVQRAEDDLAKFESLWLQKTPDHGSIHFIT
jgi:hypothetical protein